MSSCRSVPAKRRWRAAHAGVRLLALLGIGLAPPGVAGPSLPLDSDYLIRAWEAADGLPENSATAIVRTPDGYLWLGTFNGLVRFNGIDFTVYNPANTPQLPSAGIVNLHLDKRSRLWVSTYTGLVVLDGTRWREMYRTDGSANDLVRTFADRTNGDLLITTFNGRLFEFAGEQLTELPAPPGDQGEGYFGGADEDGRWWAVQNKFIGRWEDGRWVPMFAPPDVPSDAVGCAPARDGGLWLLLSNELRKLRRGAEIARVTLPERLGGVWSLSEDSQGNVWVALYNRGFCRVSPEGTMTRWNAHSGGSDNGRCVVEDCEGNLWLGTSGDGLFRLTRRRFRHFGLVDSPKGVVVQSVSVDPNGGVWAATYGHGLFLLNEAGATNITLSGAGDSPAYLQSVLADRAGRLWVSTMGAELRLVEGSNTRRVPQTQTAGGNVIALFEDSRGMAWHSGGGPLIGSSDGTSFQTFGPADGLLAGGIACFAEDTSGALWAASTSAVFRRDRPSSFVEVKDAAGEAIRGIACLKADADGSMWLGSSDRGLLRWKGGRLNSVPLEDGLPVSAVQGIVEDASGFCWMTSGRSVVRVRLRDLHAVAEGRMAQVPGQVFDARDGLPKGEFTTGRQPTCARDARGRLWFAMTKGVAMVDPAALRLNERPPPVHVEEISSFRSASTSSNQAADRLSLQEVQSRVRGPFVGPVFLPPGSRRIEIRYAGLSLGAPEKVRYQTKLEGEDADWRDVGNRRVAYFLELPPRDYVFRVRAANNDGVWNEAGASLAFSVLPLFWQTIWFRLAVALLLVGLGATVAWGWSRGHVRRALEQERAAREIRELAGRLIHAQENERTRLARELHDDITQRLARLAIDVGLCERGTADLTPTEAARSVREGLIQLSEDVHALSYRLHPSILEDLGLAVALRAEIERFQRQHSLPIKVELRELPSSVPRDSALCLFRVAQEALQNIARHARARTVEISLRVVDGGALLAVRDDGSGFDPARQRTRPSLGLSSMRERVLSLGGHLDLESAPEQGTTIVAWVPLPGAD